ncbi:MAG: acyltransferase [Verrucomicrobia bacterium]|nr:acyltransferase [Verrucomicrobiota bacterium]
MKELAISSLEDVGGRLPGLDLLRTLAIGLVVVFHMNLANPPAFLVPIQQCGFMGVDLFFVLSGYLIGSQLLRYYRRDATPSVRVFFLRRAFRVLPAFLVVLSLYLLLPDFRERPHLPDFWRFLTFTMNLGLHAPAAFSHAWSLCVEEHFYLVFPFLVIWLMRGASLWKSSGVVLAILVGGLLIRYLIWQQYLGPIATDANCEDLFVRRYWEFIYFPTYSRLDGLLVGVVLAAVRIFRPRWWRTAMAKRITLLIVALAMLSLAVWISWDLYAFSAIICGFPLTAIAFGLLLLAVSDLRTPVPGAALGAALAYSVYLTHKEMMHLDRVYLKGVVNFDGPAGVLVYVVTILAVGATLYLCVERPFLRLRDRILSRARAGDPNAPAIPLAVEP